MANIAKMYKTTIVISEQVISLMSEKT